MSTGLIVTACVVCFVLGTLSIVLLANLLATHRREAQNVKQKIQPKRKPKRKKKEHIIDRIGTMNFILIIVGITLLVFTVVIINLFKMYGSIPDTLVQCVFAVLGGECGVMGWIKTTKEKNKDREWQKEDREEAMTPATGGDELPPD